MKTNCILNTVLENGNRIEKSGFPFVYDVFITPGYGRRIYRVIIYRTLFKTKFKVYKDRYNEYSNREPVMVETYTLDAWKQIKAKYQEKLEKIWDGENKRKLEETDETRRFFVRINNDKRLPHIRYTKRRVG